MRTNGADDAGPAELGRRVVLGVERGQPLHTSAAILLVDERVTHCVYCGAEGGGRVWLLGSRAVQSDGLFLS